MSFPNDDQLNRFRLDSDRAFREMQATADQEMADFLCRYGQGLQVSEPAAMTPAVMTSVPVETRPRVRLRAEAPPQVAELKLEADAVPPTVTPVIAAPATESFDSFSAIGEDIKGDLESVGRGAIADTKGWLRTASMDLGARAKREAEAMREAAKRVMQEEKNLRGIKQRAQQELQEAKARMKNELADAKDEALTNLEGIATGALGDAQQHGRAAADAAQKRARLELDDIWGAPNPRNP